MLFPTKNLALSAAALILFAGAAVAQVTSVEGMVRGEDGQPVKSAVIRFDRTDIKGHYEVKTDKKGHYGHYGLPIGTYDVSLVIDGAVKDKLNGVKTHPGDPIQEDFDMKKTMAQNKALQQAAATGTLTKDQERSMSADQKAAFEKANKENEAKIAKNKALNDAYGAGKAAMDSKNYDEAITQFSKAAEIDATQPVIFSQMAAAYEAQAQAKPADAAGLREKEFDAWKKAIALKPDEAAYYNNYALALGRNKNIPDAQTNIDKAAQLDPTNAGKYFYNMGALLMNSGQGSSACDTFKKATTADPNYADAQYQYGLCLVGQAKTDKNGKVIPPDGTVEAFQKYLQLKPDGPNAEPAKAMLASMQGAVSTEYVNPDAKKTSTRKK